jgi:phosphatidylglycerophosphatase A
MELRPVRRLAAFIAAGFGSGWAPKAPGTGGSLVGLLIGGALLHLAPLLLLTGTLVATYGGLWAIRAATGLPWLAGGKTANDDPGWIVIDEIAGQMLSLLALHRPSILGLAAAFALFRLFDIAKPGPIGWADSRGGAAGIMADDILAGAAAGLILLLGQAAIGHFVPGPFAP